MHDHVIFLNHSCILIQSETTKILCDPWFFGTSFGDGWSLLYDNSHDINEIEFDYIWISHEHPDHFSIPTINSLKKPTTFLYQETLDKKVKHFLEKKGHDVVELCNKHQTQIGDLKLTSISCDGYDTSLIVEYPDGRIFLNTNDARVDVNNNLEHDILPLLGTKRVDLLAFQFSYANWAGNHADADIPLYQQKLVDQLNDYCIRKLKPKAVMPFASFVYYSHEENFFWNENNWFTHVFERLRKGTPKLIFPTPGQKIRLNDTFNSELKTKNTSALKFWLKLHENISIKNKSFQIPVKTLEEKYGIFHSSLIRENKIFSTIKPNREFDVTFNLTDINKKVTIGLFQKKFQVSERDGLEVATISSQVLDFILSNKFGRGTVTINGRIQFNYKLAHRFFLFFFFYYANNIGIKFDHKYQITSDILMSVGSTAVLESIINFCPEVETELKKDVAFMIESFFDGASLSDTLEIFNQEPPNEKLVQLD